MIDYSISSDFIPGLVSIIIPTHNREDLIAETIDSVFSQTYDKIELIIVNDNSADNTENVILESKNKSKLFDFKYIKSNKNGGQAARNIGLSLSRGEFIQFFDDDDIMCPEHIQKKVEALSANQEAGYVTCNFVYFEVSLDNIVSKKTVHNVVHTIESHILTHSLPTPIFMCRRSCFHKIGFWNEKIGRLQDLSYFQRLFLNDIRGYYLPDYLFKVRKHAKSITLSPTQKSLNDKIIAYNTVKLEYCQAKKYSRLLGDVLLICEVGCLVEGIKLRFYTWSILRFLWITLTNPVRVIRLGITRFYYAFLSKTKKNFYTIFFS